MQTIHSIRRQKSRDPESKEDEQAGAHGAMGRAALKWKIVRRIPVNGVVRLHRRAQW